MRRPVGKVRLTPWVVCLAVAGGTGCASDDDDSAGASGAGGGGPTQNVYLAQVRGAGCLPRPLTVDASGHVPCQLVEARPKVVAACACDDLRGRAPVSEPTTIVPAVDEYLRNVGACGTDQTPRCGDQCYCQLTQFSGAELLICEGAASDPGTQYGFCYVDPQIDSNGDGVGDANPELLAECDESERRKLRFMGADLPAADATVFVACLGQTAAP